MAKHKTTDTGILSDVIDLILELVDLAIDIISDIIIN